MLHRLTQHVSVKALLIAAATAALVACGMDQVAGIQGTGAPVASSDVTSVGPISGFGSVIQGGIEYQTTAAQIQIEDQPATEAQLQVGEQVTIRGTVNPDGTTGVATAVSSSAELRGPVTQVDTTAGTFTVLGQVVRITDDTLFDDSLQLASIEGIKVGATIEVSGTSNAAGEIVASRVEPAGGGALLQVKGKVQSLDTTAHTFSINGLTVNYSNVTPTGTLMSSSTVLVRGLGVTNGVFIAADVRVLGAPAFVANANGRFEGLITAFTSNAAFTVGSQQVTTDSTTVFDLGGATLGVDVPVRVRGVFNAAGVLAASRVEVKAKNLSIVRGLVDAVSAANGTLTVMGIAITTECQHLVRRQIEPARAVLQARGRADRGLRGSARRAGFGRRPGRDPARAQPAQGQGLPPGPGHQPREPDAQRARPSGHDQRPDRLHRARWCAAVLHRRGRPVREGGWHVHRGRAGGGQGSDKALTAATAAYFGHGCRSPAARAGPILPVVAYVLLYVALTWLSYAQPVLKTEITPWNPQTGLTVAFLLLYGPRLWPVTVVAAFLSGAADSSTAVVSMPLSALACLWGGIIYGALAAVLRRLDLAGAAAQCRRRRPHGRGHSGRRVTLVAIGSVGLFVATGDVSTADALRGIARYGLADINGILILTPLLVLGGHWREGVGVLRNHWREAALQGALVLATLLMVFFLPAADQLRFFYLLFVPIIWIALSWRSSGALFAVLAIQVGLIIAARAGVHTPRFLDLQVLLLTLVLTALLLGAVVAERAAILHRLRERDAELARATRFRRGGRAHFRIGSRAESAHHSAGVVSARIGHPCFAPRRTPTRSCERRSRNP